MSKTNKQYVLESVSELKSLQGTRISKYTRNYRLYESTRGISLDSLRSNGSVGFYKDSSSADVSPDISLNVIKSCTDTLASDMGKLKARPYFNTVNGNWREIQITKTAQRYFDQKFEYDGINKEVTEAFRNACIFDTGVLFINPFDKTVKSVLPFQVFIRPAEETYGKLTRVYYELKDYPTSRISDYKGKQQYTTYGYYFDTEKHIAARMLADTGEVIVTPFDSDLIPFVFMHYQRPIVGSSSSSIADILASIQIAINFLLNRYKDASQKNPAQTFFVPEGSSIEAFKLNNEIGNIISYATTSNMTGSPVTVATPSFIDGQYLDGVERLKALAYEMIGLSPTSVAGLKQKGADSGVALETLDSIESERFQTQTDQLIRTYKDIVRIMIQVFPADDDILEKDMFTSPFKWEDIVKLNKKMKIQYSVADVSSKDPSTKIQMIQMLKNTGLASDEMLLQMLDLPDLDLAQNYLNNTWNAIQTVINRCIEFDTYDVPMFVSFTNLMSEILNTQLILFAADPINNEGSIIKLTKLFGVVYEKNKKAQALLTGMPLVNAANGSIGAQV